MPPQLRTKASGNVPRLSPGLLGICLRQSGTVAMAALFAISLAAQELDWGPKVALADGLKETIAYFRKIVA